MFGARPPSLRRLGPAAARAVEELRSHIDPDRLRPLVESFPAPRNRLHAPRPMETADRLILDAFASAGWEATTQPFEEADVSAYVDHGGFRETVIHERLVGANVIGSRGADGAGDPVLVVAHHDTVRDTPGADDNTASVAALLEVARLLSNEPIHSPVVLAAVDMEEIGLFGSRALVRRTVMGRRIVGAIVFETMAFTSAEPNSQTLPPGLGVLYRDQVRRIRERGFRGDWTNVMCQASSTSLARTFGEALAHLTGGPDAVVMVRDPLDLPMIGGLLGRVAPFVKEFGRSDHRSFWEAGQPAILVNDTANFRNPNYHLPTDTPDTLDYGRLADIVAATAWTVRSLVGRHTDA